MSNVGYATLQIVPSAKGFGAALAGQAGPAGTAAGAVAGKGMGTALVGALKRFAAPIAAALSVGAFVQLGAEFDSMRDTIIVGTGASGAALDGLMQSAKNVGGTTASSFGDIGTAVADLNTRLGLTGKPLEDLSSRFLDLSRLTGTDLQQNIANTTRVFGDWSIGADGQAAALDKVFEATKRTGIGLDQLTTLTVQYGAPLRQLGFGFEETLALFGKFEQEGVNTETVFAGLRQGLSRMARAGEEPVDTFHRVVEEIKAAGSAGEANALALETFGARAGPDMAAAIREGRFEIDDLVAGIEGSGGALQDASERTRSMGESWQILKNRLEAAISPAALKVFDWLGEVLETHVMPAVDSLIAGIGNLRGPFESAKATVLGFLGSLQSGGEGGGLSGFVASLQSVWTTLSTQIIPAVMSTAQTIGSALLPVFQTISGFIMGAVVPAWQSLAAIYAEQVLPALATFSTFVSEVVAPRIAEMVAVVNERLQPVLQAVQAFIVERVVPAVEQIATKFREWQPAIQAVITVIVNIVSWLVKVAATILGTVIPPIISFIGWLVGHLVGAIVAVIDVIVKIIGWIANFVLGIGDAISAVGDFASNVGDKIGEVFQWFKDLPGRVVSAIGDLGSTLWSAGRDLIQGFIDGIKGMAGNLIATVKSNVTDALPGFVKDALGIHSPSRVFMALGEYTAEGMAVGLEKGAKSVHKAASAITPATVFDSPEVGLSGSGSGALRGGDTYHLDVTIPAKDVEEFRTVVEFFENARGNARRKAGV